MKKPALLALVILLVGAIWLIVPLDKRVAKSSVTMPFVYGQEDVARFLRKNGIAVEVVSTIRRNASGTELFVYLFDSPSNRFSVVKIATNGLTQITTPGRGAFLGSDENVAAWYGDSGDALHFQNGQFLRLPTFSLFDVDPSGTYFIIGEKPNRAWLGRVRSPQEKVVIATNLLAGHVFVSGDRIYVTGTSYTRNSSGGVDPLATCLILKDEGEDFKNVERLDFGWSSGIVEVDPFADRLLLWDRALVTHSVYSYDLATKQRRRVGWVGGFQFFLVTDLLK